MEDSWTKSTPCTYLQWPQSFRSKYSALFSTQAVNFPRISCFFHTYIHTYVHTYYCLQFVLVLCLSLNVSSSSSSVPASDPVSREPGEGPLCGHHLQGEVGLTGAPRTQGDHSTRACLYNCVLGGGWVGVHVVSFLARFRLPF